MSTEVFKDSLVEMVVKEGVPLKFFSSSGFKRISGEIAQACSVLLDRENIRKLTIDKFHQEKQQLIDDLSDQFVHLKIDACTRLRKNYCAINVRYVNKKMSLQQKHSLLGIQIAAMTAISFHL